MTDHTKTDTEQSELTALSGKVLSECIASITGRTDLAPRPGQVALMGDVCGVVPSAGHLLGVAGTGVGKSLAYLVPAMTAAAQSTIDPQLGPPTEEHPDGVPLRYRTVVSTEMVSLQTQIIDKDAPVVAAAVEKVTGYRPEVALMKGWQRYACAASTVAAVEDVLDTEWEGYDRTTLRTMRERLATARAKAARSVKQSKKPESKEQALARVELIDLLDWSLGQCLGEADEHGNRGGDKDTYPGSLTDGGTGDGSRQWAQVSVSSTDCMGAEKCPLADFCLPREARERVAEADVIVTNHTLLAIQAANEVPVVIGNRNIGRVAAVVVDEAHSLPQIVRAQGAREVSSRTFRRLARGLESLMDISDKMVSRHLENADHIMGALDTTLAEWADRIKPPNDVLRLTQGDDPLAEVTDLLSAWLKGSLDLLKSIPTDGNSMQVRIKVRRLQNQIASFAQACKSVANHEAGTARWIEWEEHAAPKQTGADGKTLPRTADRYPVARFSPVDVAPMLRRGLWSADDFEARDAMVAAGEWNEDDPPPRYDLTVVAVSATLPGGFARQMGMRGANRTYASPFDTAYGASALFVPRASAPQDREALIDPKYGRFSTDRHIAWATKHLVELVEANDGAALVLAATVKAGKAYAEALRAANPDRLVLSQWDGAQLRQQVAAWKAERSSVLVGVKSLMTGVDHPGDGCSLVVIDRPARARSNPTDDARVELLMQPDSEGGAGMDKWGADCAVYVEDAASLLAQSAGRLIRTVNDSGMVAVLDPRLLDQRKGGTFQSYPHNTRQTYLRALSKFTTRMADLDQATAWLKSRRIGLSVAVSA